MQQGRGKKPESKPVCVPFPSFFFFRALTLGGKTQKQDLITLLLIRTRLPLNTSVRFGFHFQTIPHHREQISSQESTENTSKSHSVNNERAENFLIVCFFSKNSLIIISKALQSCLFFDPSGSIGQRKKKQRLSNKDVHLSSCRSWRHSYAVEFWTIAQGDKKKESLVWRSLSRSHEKFLSQAVFNLS